MKVIRPEESSDLYHMQQAVELHSIDKETSFWSNGADLAIMEMGIQASYRWPQSRNERVARIRAKFENGTYHVESLALARCMLDNENHFLSVTAH